LCRENSALAASLACLKRFNDLSEQLASMLVQAARYNLTDLFTVQMRKVLENDEEFLRSCHTLLPHLVESKLSKDEVNSDAIIFIFMFPSLVTDWWHSTLLARTGFLACR
jgi:hypothetical protein